MSDELEEHSGDWHMGYLAGHAAAEAVYEAAKKAVLDRRSSDTREGRSELYTG